MITIVLNGEQRQLPPPARLTDLLAGRPTRGIAVAVDGAVIPRGDLAQTELHDGARVEIVTAVQGG